MTTVAESCERRVTKILLVIENRLLRETMSAIFRKQADFQLVDSIRSCETVYKQAACSCCDILLADQASAAAFPANFVGDFLVLAPAKKAILFGMEEDTEMFLQAVRSGVSGLH